MRGIRAVLALVLLLAAVPASPGVGVLAPEIPEVLEPWIPWVLEGEDQRDCPLVQDAHRPGEGDGGPARLCAWPGRLHLDLDAAGGLFAQHWFLHAPAWVSLPGDVEHWPQGTRSGETPVPVVLRDGQPAVRLPGGSHVLIGRFQWQELPRALTLPAHTGLIALAVNGEAVPAPRLDRDSRLWLGDGRGAEDDGAGDRLSVKVYRRVDDQLPLRVTTRAELEVAGRARLIQLAGMTLPGGVPLRVQSPIPARVDEDGSLLVQLRPGSWVLELEAHHPGDITRLTLAATPPPWPGQEVWSFAAAPELRQVEPQGLEAVDPHQSGVPADWLRLPAFRALPGEALVLEPIRRGDPDPGPDRLELHRELWLDFDGAGLSLRDTLTGTLTRSWRLALGTPIELGQVRVDGAPRLITRLDASDPPGVEVRTGRLELIAESRLPGPGRLLPVSGWDLELSGASARLHLPPGWDLLAVAGSDNLPASWVSRWSLLDLFLVLIAAFGATRLWGPAWGALAFAALVLTWQEPQAPQLVWLHLLAAAALLRVLPRAGGAALWRVRWLVAWYGRLAVFALAVVGLPFVVSQVQEGIWPQLAGAAQMLAGGAGQDAVSAGGAQTRESAAYGGYVSELGRSKKAADVLPSAPQPLDAGLDPGAKVQSGPGMPDWSWASFELRWAGPVLPGDTLQLWLVSPGWNLLWSLAGAVLVSLLGMRLARAPGLWGPSPWDDPRQSPGPGGRPAGSPEAATEVAEQPETRLSLSPTSLLRTAITVGLGLSLLVLAPRDGAHAEPIPSQGMLEELKARLMRPPECVPDCVALTRLTLTADPGRLRLDLVIDAAAESAVPIPGGTGGWVPERLMVDGKPLDAVRRDDAERLLVPLGPGRHRLVIEGALPDRGQVEIPFPLQPRHTRVQVSGWSLEGLDAAGAPGAQIRLVRLGEGGMADGPLEVGTLPSLLSVERTLRLGLDWRVHTRVKRLSPAEYPVVVGVPLLTGESVQTEGVQVRDGRALVSLAPGDTETAWESGLEQTPKLALAALSDPGLTERWILDVSPRWHVTWDGPAPMAQRGETGRRLPVWAPLPGETLTLSLTRPSAVPGQTLTLDLVELESSPGRRAGTSSLVLLLRGTQGGRHRLRLPEGAVPLSLAVDGESRALPSPGEPMEIALRPGEQRVELQWREPRGIVWRYQPGVPELGVPAVNVHLGVALPSDRWLLFARGPGFGPVVLFWGVLLVLVVLAWLLGRTRLTPLGFADWLLLAVGIALALPWAAPVVALWLLALGWRRGLDASLPRWRYNLIQLALVVLTLAALGALVAAVSQGLLGRPEMQIAGNGSSAGRLLWYQDRIEALPGVEVWSAPIWVYRALMLAWALWLAWRLLQWLRWGLDSLVCPVLWREPANGDTGLRGLLRRPRRGSQ